MKNRYFLVFFKWNTVNSNGDGNVPYITEGNYVNKNDCVNLINDELKKSNDLTIRQISFTNIIELSESDYSDYIR